MPVKVRCRGCGKVLNAPDRARGKAIKCPNCEGVVRIPAGDGRPARQRKPAAKRPRPSGGTAATTEEAIAGLDLRHAEDRSVRVCPKCGAEVGEEDLDCPACGIDLETGKVSERVLRAKGLLGPEPGEFYGKAWSDSARFVLDNKHLVFRTGMYWTVLLLLYIGSMLVLNYLIVNYGIPAENPSRFEQVMGGKWPLKIFFGVLAFIFQAGMMGWYWRLSIQIIRTTLARKSEIRKVSFDLFEAVALGCKVVIWPYVFLLPVFFVIGVFVGPVVALGSMVVPVLGGLAMFAVIFGTYCLPIIVFPVVMVHMSMPYTYKAWLPTEMIKVWAKNIGPALYWLMLYLVVNLPVVGIVFVIALFIPHIVGFFDETLGNWATWFLGLVWQSNMTSGFFFQLVRGILAIFFAVLLISPITFLAAIPAVFSMRANGLLAFYRKDRLELVREKAAHDPAGFWVRYLALLVDRLLLPLTPFIIIKNRKAAFFIWVFVAALIVSFLMVPTVFVIVFPLWPVIFGFVYYTVSESSHEQGTIGKHALGLVVVSEKGMKQLTFRQAASRYIGRLLAALPLGLGFLFAAFTPKKQGLHDMVAKTMVVFKGDDETSTL